MKVVIDASILIDHLRGGRVWRKFLKEAGPETELYLSTIVIFELFSGKSMENPNVLTKVAKLLKLFETIDFDVSIAKRAGQLYRDISETLDVPDYIIAASALSIGGMVLTLNKKHFQKIPGLDLYIIS